MDGRCAEVPYVRGGLARFETGHYGLRVDGAEGVDYYFAFDGLDWVDHYCYGSWV